MASYEKLHSKWKSRMEDFNAETPDFLESDEFRDLVCSHMDGADSFVTGDRHFEAHCASHANDIADIYSYIRRLDLGLPSSIWKIRSSKELAAVILVYLERYLGLASEDERTVKASTLEWWAQCVLHLADDNIMGSHRLPGSVPAAFTGTAPNGSDSLESIIKKRIVPYLIHAYNLEIHPDPIEAWGPEECTVAVRYVESEAMTDPSRATQFLQEKALHQLCLAFGPRSRSLLQDALTRSSDRSNVLKQECITIHQNPRYSYTVDVNLENPKEFMTSPRLRPVTKLGNLQLEFASTLIPLAIHRKALYTKRNGTKHFFRTIDDFRDANESSFYLDGRDADLPFFRAVDKQGKLTDQPLGENDAAVNLDSVSLGTNLPLGKLKNYREYVGHVAQQAWGKEKQRVVLSYGAGDDSGRGSYSLGIAAVPITEAVLGEYHRLPAAVGESLEYADEIWQAQITPATYAVRRTQLETGQPARGGFSPSQKEVDAEVDRRRREVFDDDTIIRLRKRASDKLYEQKKLAYQRKTDDARRDGLVHEHQAARTVVNRLRQAPPFLLAAKNLGHPTLHAEINALWPSNDDGTDAETAAAFWDSYRSDGNDKELLIERRFAYMKEQLALLKTSGRLGTLHELLHY